MSSHWQIHLTPLAEEDLDYLKQHGGKKIRQDFKKTVQPILKSNPRQGQALGGVLLGVFSLHFWNDEYRVAYEIAGEETNDSPRVTVLAVGAKRDDFYRQVEERKADEQKS